MYLAIINTPGYLSHQDELPEFETVGQAWQYLAQERMSDEDTCPEWAGDNGIGEYSSTVTTLQYLSGGEHEHGNPHEDWPTAADGTGVVYGPTPGYDGDHDLGLAYSVVRSETETGKVK